MVSPTGIVYPIGTPPRRSRYSQTAALYLFQGHTDRALEMAREGVAADSTNPIHYFLAGAAAVRLDRYAEADTMFTVAERLYPAYQLQTEPERAAGWAHAYDQGVQAYGAEDTEAAMASWRDAARIYDLRPEAHRNLASLLSRDDKYDEAIDLYQRALAGLERRPATHVLDSLEVAARDQHTATTEESLAELLMFVGRYAEAEPVLRRRVERDSANTQIRADLATTLKALGRTEEAAQIYATLLSGQGMESTDLFSLGVGLFRAGDYARATQAFERLTGMRPSSRDVWFNYVNALLAAKAWPALVAAGDRLIALDPLGKNVGLIAARAHLEAGDQPGALAGLHRVDGAPLYVEGLQMRPLNSGSRVQGQIIGNLAPAGAPVRLRFTFYDEARELGAEVVEVAAPALGESQDFEVVFGAARATGFRYELVPDPAVVPGSGA
ncbi:MAG: tetratricopeptide repeat protein [Gemmatimonadetes bacterium]|nr:tetratricopeptide repeat protein [Gemmatimonadota bacterium]